MLIQSKYNVSSKTKKLPKKTIMTSYQEPISINKLENYGKLLTGFNTTIDTNNMELMIHTRDMYSPENKYFRMPFRGWIHNIDSTKNIPHELIEFLSQKLSFSQTYLFYFSELLDTLNMNFCNS